MSSSISKDPKKKSGSKSIATKGSVGGSGSKNNHGPNATSGYVGGKTNQITCYHNGKLATPQSLIPKKSSSHATKVNKKSDQVAIPQAIDEDVATGLKKISSSQDGAKSANSLSMKSSNSRLERKSTSGYAKSFVKEGAVAVEEVAVVELTETDTEFILVLPSLVAASDVREVSIVDEKNARYEAVIASHKNPDAFVPKPMQTINNPTKNQNEMTAANPLREVGSQATSYDILDDTVTVATGIIDSDPTISEGTTADITELGDEAGVTKVVKKFVCDTLSVALTANGALLDTSSVAKPEPLVDGRVVADTKSKNDTKKGRSRNAATTNESGTGSGAAVGDGSHAQIAASQQLNSVQSGDGLSGGASGYNMHGGISTAGVDNGTGDYVEQDSIQILREKKAQHILSSKALLKKLELVERAVQQNAYHKEHLDYRNLPEIVSSVKEEGRTQHENEHMFGGFGSAVNVAPVSAIAVDEEVEEEPETEEAAGAAADTATDAATLRKEPVHNGVNSKYVRKLFSWANIDLVRGRAVTAMAANTANNDIVAVGYGKLDTVPNPDAEDENGSCYGGLVLFWSLRNPDYPEKILRTPHPVTALNFSKLSPTLIAVGLYSGELMIYDVKRESDWGTPIESSQNMTGGHSDPIWDLKWLLKTNERVETLVSISTDGNVLQWSLKKGLVVSTLMQLKRGGVGEGWISRTAAGLTFDFLPEDCTRYVTGTEEGSIHLSNVSHNEQYLDTYDSQNGPVYRVLFSKAYPEMFLACSADSTMSLYHVRNKAPVLKFQSVGSTFALNDICWCPGNSTVFAAVAADAKIQLWDLSYSCIDPVTIIDTNADPALWAAGGVANDKDTGPVKPVDSDDEFDPPPSAPIHTRPPAAAPKEDDTPVSKLLKNLQQMQQTNRSLTSIIFSEHSPIIIVGDSRGVVTLYRVLKPVAVTNETRTEMSAKLKQAIFRQADPVTAAKLQSYDGSGSQQ